MALIYLELGYMDVINFANGSLVPGVVQTLAVPSPIVLTNIADAITYIVAQGYQLLFIAPLANSLYFYFSITR